MKEEWKMVTDFEFYEVSNTARIRSIDRAIPKSDGSVQNRRGKELWQNKADGRYYQVNLWKNSKQYPRYVHRIMAIEFIPNPDSKRYINHKDGNIWNNDLTNLEWCTHSENIQHFYDNLKK